ncbi:hypothetical protein Taro_027340 [Colocasia esculenta]|uniref:Alpha-1,3/1,6-mannosyltransferase ALG2 n=1 Tax=Colocasia esculenta TaxID=4460 RepID=A0A843VNE8_COLES|nr:hypothetical protein [Colocasia esculenta]
MYTSSVSFIIITPSPPPLSHCLLRSALSFSLTLTNPPSVCSLRLPLPPSPAPEGDSSCSDPILFFVHLIRSNWTPGQCCSRRVSGKRGTGQLALAAWRSRDLGNLRLPLPCRSFFAPLGRRMKLVEAPPKLKVAIIHPDLGIGGAERLIVDAAVELASHGHSVHVFTAHHDKNRCFEETITGPFQVTVYGSFIPRHIFHHFHAVCAYIRCIFVALCVLFMWPCFDVILADQVSAVIPLMKIKRSTKIVFYCHFPDLLLAKHTTLLRRIYRKPIDMIEEATTGMSDLILVNSRFTASTFANTFRCLHNRGIEPAVLYPSVDIKQFDGHCSYKLNFLSINRFERKKNIGLAISAFAMLRSFEGFGPPGHNFAKVTLTIAGGYDKRLPENVEYLKELKRLAETEGVSDQVKFVTSCSTADRNLLLSECLCVIYTPKDEHFGIVPLEAMAARKPVIACDSGGPMESIKHGITGFLCDPTPLEFSQAMHKLASDPEMAASMGEEARDHVSRTFSTNVFGEQLNRYVCDVYHRRME